MNLACWALAGVLAVGGLSQGQLPGLAPSLPRSALVVGQVLDAGTGSPISGVLVEISMQRTLSPPAFPGSIPAASNQLTETPRVLTGSDGRFVFRKLPKGSFRLTAVKPGYLNGAYGRRRPAGDAQILVLFDGQKAGGLRIYLWRHSAVSGVVVDEAGEPVVGIQMRAFLRTIQAGQRRFVNAGTVGWTDDRGVYRIHGLFPGDYLVAAVSTKVSVPVSAAEDALRGSAPGIAEIGAATTGGRGTSMQVGDALLTLGAIGDWTSAIERWPCVRLPHDFPSEYAEPSPRDGGDRRFRRGARRNRPSDCAGGHQARLRLDCEHRRPGRIHTSPGHGRGCRRHAARAGNRHDGDRPCRGVCFPRRACWPLFDPRGQGGEAS